MDSCLDNRALWYCGICICVMLRKTKWCAVVHDAVGILDYDSVCWCRRRTRLERILQPEMEKMFPFPIATSITAVIWCVWHLPIWVMPSSNHYGDSLIGFAITIFVWSFIGAAIYKATKSVLACAIYHSFINSIGAVYDWNDLFDA